MTTIPMPLAAGAGALEYPLVAQLFSKHGFAEVTPANFAPWAEAPGRAMLVFLEDPGRFKETLDLAVIVPELVRAWPGRFRVGVVLPDAGRALSTRYGFRRWPAFVMLADGQYVGVVDGLRNWDEYMAEVTALLDAAPTRPPTIGIAVKGGGDGAANCHA
jgi:hydrogenase-1 operon protein HyaE